jgi:Flp pilus assembly protein TadG
MTHTAASSFGSASAFATRRAGVVSWRVVSWLRGVGPLALRMRRTLRADGGSSLVEFAMASIILFTLVFGLLAICLALYSYNVTAEAAREATRYAIVRGSACTSFATACPATATDIKTYVQGIGFPGINPASLSVPDDCCWPKGNNNPGNPVQVTVQYTFPLVIPFVPRRILTMSSTSQMLISQ